MNSKYLVTFTVLSLPYDSCHFLYPSVLKNHRFIYRSPALREILNRHGRISNGFPPLTEHALNRSILLIKSGLSHFALISRVSSVKIWKPRSVSAGVNSRMSEQKIESL